MCDLNPPFFGGQAAFRHFLDSDLLALGRVSTIQ